jgi:hypothetical protein
MSPDDEPDEFVPAAKAVRDAVNATARATLAPALMTVMTNG